MSNSSTAIDVSYEIFNFYVPKILITILLIINCFGNGSIVWATIRRKSLQNPCNFFIAITSLSDFFAQGVLYPNVYYAFSGQHPPLGTCWRIIVFSVGMTGLTFVSTLFIGIDRFICIVFPTVYHRFSTGKFYVPFVGILSLIYGFIWIPFSYAFVIENENLPQYECGFGSFIIKDNTISIIATYSRLGLCFGMAVVYAITWTYMKFRKTNASAKRIMKSLTVITIVICITWPISITIQTILAYYPDSKTSILLLNYSIVMINSGIASNYFIFYAFSKEYRYAFQRQLAFLFCYKPKFKSSGTVFVTGVEGHSALAKGSFH